MDAIKHLSYSQGMSALIVIALFSIAGYFIAGAVAERLRLHKINKVLGRSSWGTLVPYEKANECKPGAFAMKDWK